MDDVSEAGGFAAGTAVMTPGGYRAVRCLRRGDLVTVRGVGAVPVLDIVVHRARAIRFDGVTMAARQHVLCGDACLQLHFGLDEALIPAAALGGPAMGTVTLFSPVLADHGILRIGELECDSVFVTERMARAVPHASAHRIAACPSLTPEEARLWQAWRGDPAAARAA